ncbi:RNA polymerase, sigma subunit, ECF family [Agreia bicolorata]|uniref:RNA polymerase sigma factor n=1 Tax=Agreia bicolorata TaxID=110935 RepID=A0A1T4YKZ7_9MICO|nr:RNA polymerase sigma factor [Agreia bicolorata]KJC64371.1 RNA polymerase sigma 70 [Agreia bicolorata]SKB02469.1 RNA polymerase, sigma subunit, ECF family [Agreia bicolorata]
MSAAPYRFSLEDADDRILAGRAADGDTRAFEVLARRYGPLLRAYARRILGSNNEVDDVVQETLITAWRDLPSLNDGSVVKSWLMRIASHKSIDRIRARKNHVDVDDVDAAQPDRLSPHAVSEATSLHEAVSQALATLPLDQQRCWVLREVGEHSYDEIAEQMGIPASTVRGLLSRARRNLMTEMEAWR